MVEADGERGSGEGARPPAGTGGVLLLLVAAGCYVAGPIASISGLRHDDQHTYAKAGLVVSIVPAFPLLPVWLGAIDLLLSGAGGR
jgi:hypothetical protein